MKLSKLNIIFSLTYLLFVICIINFFPNLFTFKNFLIITVIYFAIDFTVSIIRGDNDYD